MDLSREDIQWLGQALVDADDLLNPPSAVQLSRDQAEDTYLRLVDAKMAAEQRVLNARASGVPERWIGALIEEVDGAESAAADAWEAFQNIQRQGTDSL